MNSFKKLLLLAGVAAGSFCSPVYAAEQAQPEQVSPEQGALEQVQDQGDEKLDIIKERRLNFAKRVLGQYVSRHAKGATTPLIRTCFTSMIDGAVPRQASDIPYADTLEWAIPEILTYAPLIYNSPTNTRKGERSAALGLQLLKKAVSKNTDVNTPWFKKACAVLIASLTPGLCTGTNLRNLTTLQNCSMSDRAQRLQQVLDLKCGISKYLARWIKDTWIKNAVGEKIDASSVRSDYKVPFTKLATRLLTRCALKPMLYKALEAVEQYIR